MAGSIFSRFSGETPRVSAKLLAQGAAQLASNAKLTSGDLEPWAGPTFTETLTKWSSGDPVVSVHRVERNGADYWLHWVQSELNLGEVVKLFPSPTVGDIYDRLYFNKGGKLYITTKALATVGVGTDYPLAAYELGVAAPTDTPVVTPAPPAALPEDDVTVAYVYTFVTIYGEESAPSPSQAEPETGEGPGPGTPWSLTMAATPGVGNRAPLEHRRIYRTFTATDGTTEFQFVDQIPVAQTTYTDSTPDGGLGEVLSSDGWEQPPTNISAFTYMGNGVFAVISGKTLYLSEPFQPHAYPSQYNRALGFEGVALESIGNSLIVLTSGDPVVLTGTDPQFLSDAKLDINQPCVCAATVVNVGTAVAYMSPVGYVYAGIGGSNLITRPLFSKADWKRINPSSASFSTRYDDGLLFFTPSNQYLMLPSEPLALLSSLNLTEVTALYTDPETGAVYYVRNGELYEWDSNTTKLAYLWRSKIEISPRPVNLGVCQIISNAGTGTNPGGETPVPVPGGLGINESGINGAPVPYMTTDPVLTFRLYCYDPDTETYALKHTETVAGTEPFTLPSGYKTDAFYFELEGTASVHAVYIAETRKDLKAMVA